MKRPDFIVQDVYSETPRFWRCFRKETNVYTGIRELLHTIYELKFPPKRLGYLTGHSWSATTAHTQRCIKKNSMV
jgi:hypothetical protein